ncbi:hypothetical protein B0181_04305 [Moraxella caviae]|uniref:Uncharacterized protein n=1 Tax=Moraxella caviae TaxID=34060 RepID=A0A1T0A550_9GAMM|nr:hypothetical protein [Moraxella caviae]OOR90827.1 hypothetical protein B0181_04305 [Moraxella caviae]STZ10657.1 Uncharacterised protein [Moraxella caviae]VEW10564.1 Uncharacterised protein [Moraxella caviae]
MNEIQNHNLAANPKPISLGEWLLTLLILSIPVVNIIALLIWAFSRSTNPSKSNFAKAQLIFIVLVIIFAAAFALFGIKMGAMSV